LKNGGLYIKTGQGISAINHILPKEYTDTLKKLEDSCLERKPNEVRKLFLQDFNLPPESIFAEFDYKPIASASLAQVFRAKTKEGDDVAVKVQYIDLQKRFRSDFATILFLQDMIGLIHTNYNFGWILLDVKRALEMELDFLHEGRNGEQCAKDLKNLSFVYVPKIYWDYTNTRVLTAEYIDNACKISNVQELKNKNLDIKDIDKKLFQMFAQQIFNTGSYR
jgi:aarF domain-containing kinase